MLLHNIERESYRLAVLLGSLVSWRSQVTFAYSREIAEFPRIVNNIQHGAK